MTAAARRPIRVLHLRDSPWVDGPGRTILETAARIDRGRIDYHIGALVTDPAQSHPLVDAARERGLPIHAIHDPGDSLRALVDRVVMLIDELGSEILHSSEFRTNMVALWCRRRRPGLRLVSTAHGWIANDLRGRVTGLADRILMRTFERIILVSSAMRRQLPHWWIPDVRVRVLRNALDLERYGRGADRGRRRVPGRGDSVTILNVGRLSVEKGQSLLLRAVAALADDYPTLRLIVAGVGPLESKLKRLMSELGIAERVSFPGYVTDMPGLYGSVDLVVQSSFTEGLPNVVLEALHLGVPIVATDVGGTREVIDHGVTGWLIRPRRVSAIVEGIRAFLERPTEFIAMRQAGRCLIEAEFSITRRTAAQTCVYEELLGTSA